MRAIRKMEPAWEKVQGENFPSCRKSTNYRMVERNFNRITCSPGRSACISPRSSSVRDLKALDSAYSIVFPNFTPINVNKKKRNYEDSIP